MHGKRWIKSGRAVLAAELVGQGRPVVFLHANVCDSRMWRAQVDACGAGGTMAVAYDRRGFGETVTETEPYSPVADLLTVIDAVADGRPAILVGCSQGGKIAIDAALLHPSRVAGLLLVSPSVGGAPEPEYTPEMRGLLARLKAAEDAGDLDRVNAIKAHLWLDGPLAREGRVAGRARDLFLEMNGIALRSIPAGPNLDTAPAFDRMREVRVPSLVIWGNLDFPHIQDRCREMAKRLPNASAHGLPEVAHVPSLEHPAAVTAPLMSFLERIDHDHGWDR